MVTLGLHQMTALDVDPVELAAIAAKVGCGEISVFVHRFDPRSQFPLVTSDNLRAFQRRLHETGVRVANIEAFMLTPEVDVATFRPALALGAELGARGLGVILADTEADRVVANLSQLCDLAAENGLRVGIEFMPLMPAWRSLPEALALIGRVDRENLGVGLDVLHLVRSGGSAAEIAAMDSRRIAYVQLCDSDSLDVTAEYAEEAAANRLAPGEGRFPLTALLQTLPITMPLELEVPQTTQRPAPERIEHLVASTRRLLATAGRE